MDEGWVLESEEYVLMTTSAPRYQNTLSERQIDLLDQVYNENEVTVVDSGQENKVEMAIGGKEVNAKEDESARNTRMLYALGDRNRNDGVELVFENDLKTVFYFDSNQIRLRSLHSIQFNPEAHTNRERTGNDSYDESSEEIEREQGRVGATGKKKRRSKKEINVQKSVQAFTNMCIKDMKSRIIKSKAQKKLDKLKLQMLVKGKKAKVQSIHVEKVTHS